MIRFRDPLKAIYTFGLCPLKIHDQQNRIYEANTFWKITIVKRKDKIYEIRVSETVIKSDISTRLILPDSRAGQSEDRPHRRPFTYNNLCCHAQAED